LTVWLLVMLEPGSCWNTVRTLPDTIDGPARETRDDPRQLFESDADKPLREPIVGRP